MVHNKHMSKLHMRQTKLQWTDLTNRNLNSEASPETHPQGSAGEYIFIILDNDVNS